MIDDKTEKVIEEAKFTIVWKKEASGWKLSRIVSYDHKPVSKVDLTDKQMDALVGEYEVTADQSIVITKDKTMLHAKEGDWSADLHSESPTTFYLNYSNVRFEFVKGKSGHIEKLVVYENGAEVERAVKKK